MLPLPERRAAALQVAIATLLAGVWRAYLAPRYFGWEEGDYGNLMMIREVVDSGFTWFRPSHMPGWYAASAVLHPLIPDPRAAGLVVTLAFSAVMVGAATLLTRALLGGAAAWLVAFWLCLQPEASLYGASTLRSPAFASLATMGLTALVLGARDRGFGAIALAFLTRMEGFFSLFVPALWSWARDSARGPRSLVVPLLLLGGAAVGWQAYVTGVHDEGFFVLGPLGINCAGNAETSPAEAFEVVPWVREGLLTAWWLLTWTLPRKISWTWTVLAGFGAWALWRRGEARPGGRSVVAFAGFSLAFWLGEGFVSHHEPNHNLYWVWMLHAVPFLAVLAAAGWKALDRRLVGLHPGLRGALLVLVALSALPAFVHETHYQARRSAHWYRPQLDLSRWMEDELPAGTGVLVSSIPEVFLKRKESQLAIHSWWLLPDHLDGSDRSAFGDFLNRERVDYVQWFSEEWTDSARIAPWLAAGVPVTAGPVALSPVDREDGYGWILYVVSRPGAPIPQVPPAFGQGARGPGWSR